MAEDKMVGWHHQLDEYEFEQAPGNGEGQGSLACYNLWGCKEIDMTERLNNIRYRRLRGLLQEMSFFLLHRRAFGLEAFSFSISYKNVLPKHWNISVLKHLQCSKFLLK